MKKILITGKNSYIGKSLENWLEKEADKYRVDRISLRDESWKERDLSHYDVVFHVAGITHVKETRKNRNLFYEINRDLAYEFAKKSKSDGVKQFIFLSSMAVYGMEKGFIDKNTLEKPVSAYGKSKLEGEEWINKLADESFIVANLRPPMVYGKGCKGNYPRLVELVLKTPIFPSMENKRSMIYMDNLSGFVRDLIDKGRGGLFFPQNDDYVNISDMVRIIAQVHGKRIVMTNLFNPVLRILNISIINKLFGDLVYDMSMSKYDTREKMSFISFRESIKIIEK